MTALDNIKAALGAGPTEGPWHTVQVGDNPTKFAVANAEGISLLTLVDEEGHDFAAVYEDADSTYIAACNPTAIRELLAYVESLERERDEARRTVRMAHEMGTQVVAERDALQAKVESLEKDAARYRWLRTEQQRIDPICHLSWKRDSNRSSSEWVNTAHLDAAIDAAMEQTK